MSQTSESPWGSTERALRSPEPKSKTVDLATRSRRDLGPAERLSRGITQARAEGDATTGAATTTGPTTAGRIATDRCGTILRADLRAQVLLGLPEQWMMGKPLTVFVPLDLRRLFRSNLSRALRGAGESRWEMRLAPRSGGPFDAVITVAPIRSPAGMATGLQWRIDGAAPTTSVATRVHAASVPWRARRAASGAVVPMSGEVAHSARLDLLGVMAAAAVHELSQPVSAIGALAHGLVLRLEQGTLEAGELQGAVSGIERQAARAGALIGHIRGFARPDAPGRAPHDLASIVRTTLEFAEMLTREIPTVRVQCGDSLPPALVSPVQIQQVILNLIQNAVEAMRSIPPSDRALWVRTERSERGVTVRVRDTGCGVGLEADRIFAPFYSTRQDGMGLGLAICRAIVEDHGGRIWARPNPGSGAEIGFTLPAEPGARP